MEACFIKPYYLPHRVLTARLAVLVTLVMLRVVSLCAPLFLRTSVTASVSQDAGSLRKKNKKKKRVKALNTRTSSGDSDAPVNMTNSATELVQPDLPASRSSSKTSTSAQVFMVFCRVILHVLNYNVAHRR